MKTVYAHNAESECQQKITKSYGRRSANYITYVA